MTRPMIFKTGMKSRVGFLIQAVFTHGMPGPTTSCVGVRPGVTKHAPIRPNQAYVSEISLLIYLERSSNIAKR